MTSTHTTVELHGSSSWLCALAVISSAVYGKAWKSKGCAPYTPSAIPSPATRAQSQSWWLPFSCGLIYGSNSVCGVPENTPCQLARRLST